MERGGVGGARPAGAGDEFAGFPSSGRATPVPNLFFARLLPDIERAEELLVTLYIFYIQGLQRRSPFFVTGSELAADGTLVRALANLCGEGGEALGRGLALLLLQQFAELALGLLDVALVLEDHAEGLVDHVLVELAGVEGHQPPGPVQGPTD